MKTKNINASVKLFCLPFAGGHRYSYREYVENAPPFLNIIPLEYPGRVSRMQDPLITNIDDLVEDIYIQITSKLDQSQYAIYGHSMGGLVASLLTRKLLENNYKPPLHLFITGTSGPSSESRFDKIRHLLPQDEFIQEMKELDGIPHEILENDELLSYFGPILRADFEACETYKHIEGEPYNIPMTVITGTEEDMKMDDIYLWQKETTFPVEFRQMPGKHFFIFKYPHEIIKIISKTLLSYE